MRDLHDTELLKAVQPERHGGFEVGLDDALRITAALGRGCGATAWVYGVLSDHQITLGMYSAEAQEDVWGESPAAVACSGLALGGEARLAIGGYRVSGRWSFSSGSDHSAWVFVHSNAPTESEEQTRRTAYYLVPRAYSSARGTYVKQVLAPSLKLGDTAIMDSDSNSKDDATLHPLTARQARGR